MIDNTLGTSEQTKEPRRGIAPFAGGIEEQGKDSEVSYINYKDFSLGDLGKFVMSLSRPHNEKLKDHTNENDQGFTIDLAGRIRKGNLRDFLRQGYFEVNLIGEYPPPSGITDEAPDEILKLNLWINNTQTMIPFNLFVPRGDDAPYSSFFIFDQKKRLEHFVLRDNPDILQAVRLNVGSE